MTVSADLIRIAQVLRNLVENAVRYTSTGHVQVRVEPFVIPAAAASAPSTPEVPSAAAPEASSLAGELRFVVRDTGPGLPASAAERLKRAALPFTSGSDGTGIGLFVIRDVLQQLGGRIDVQTRDGAHPRGQGTTFTVSIPAVQFQDAAPRMDRDERHDALDVLVVDDLPEVRDSLSDVTRRLGHVCHAVGSAAEARPCWPVPTATRC